MSFEEAVKVLGTQRLKIKAEVRKLEQSVEAINEKSSGIQAQIAAYYRRIEEIDQAIERLKNTSAQEIEPNR